MTRSSWRTNRYYLAIRKLVDDDLARLGRPVSPTFIILPIVPAAIVLRNGGVGAWLFAVVMILLSLTTLLLLAWRAWRLMAARDFHYDRHERFTLSSEYADSMSAAEARRRRRRSKPVHAFVRRKL